VLLAPTPGGISFFGNVIIPFVDKFLKDISVYNKGTEIQAAAWWENVCCDPL
jgi:hypothetical protein